MWLVSSIEGPISNWLTSAAAMILLLGLAHSVLGERYLLRRLFRRPDLPHLFGSDDFTKRTLRFAWHLTTIAWWGLAALIVKLGQGEARDSLLIISVTAFLSAVIALVGSRGRHLSWIVFVLVGVSVWVGGRAL